MAFSNSESFNLSVIHPLFGDGLNIPNIIRSAFPGSASIYAGYFGTGSLFTLGTTSFGAGPSPDKSLTMNTLGLNLHDGITTQLGAHITNGENVTLGIQLRSAVVSNSLTASESSLIGKNTNIVGKNINIGGKDIYIGAPKITITAFDGSISGVDISGCTGKKAFDIKHPSKENHRLRYICLEGPGADIFIRGKLNGASVIKLPDYWKDLVDEESITVNLTPIGQYQELYVEKIVSENQVHVKSNSGKQIKCFYTVYGERKDTSKNISEYVGSSSADYPGNNSEYVINGVTDK
jgi:hypothetical protein